MFRTITPEQAGVDSAHLRAFLETVQANHLAVHSIIMAKGNDIFFEHYMPPFHKDFSHRIYSSTKSFVALGIGCLVQDGLLSLDDTMQKLFPKETANVTDQRILNQTVRNMLMMSTMMGGGNWFTDHNGDRVNWYFSRPAVENRIPGKTWCYDSSGTFVLCALIERLSGMDFMSYLRLKFLDKIGFSKEARCLKCPGGHSWGDSAILCTARDLLAAARLTLNGGAWNGEQLLNADYLREATSYQIANAETSIKYDQQGYGYKFWMTYGKAYCMLGMGSQMAVCVPEKDLIFVVQADTQGVQDGQGFLVDSFFNLIVNNAGAPLPESPAADALQKFAATLTLTQAEGSSWSWTAKKINGVEYVLEENKMGMTNFRFDFDATGGIFTYTNATGEKKIEFGMTGYGNRFALFPEEGYSKDIGGISEPGHKYKCAASAGWKTADTLSLRVQIIDDYFGNFIADFTFNGDEVELKMAKAAEAFLNNYDGTAMGRKA